MSKLRVNTVVNRTNTDKVIFPYGIGVTNGIVCSGVVTATSFVGSGVSLTGVQGNSSIQDESGNEAFSGITTIRVGHGLTVNSPSAGIASIKASGTLDILRVSGNSIFGSPGVTSIASSGAIRSQAFGSIIPQKLPDPSYFTSQLAIDFDGAVVHRMSDGAVYLASATGNWLKLAFENHTVGIITSTCGFVAAGSSLGFTGPLYSTGISTAAFLQATTVNVSTAATVGTSLTVTQDLNVGRNVLVSGVATAKGLTLNGDALTGRINSSGISTITQLIASTVNASGIITASQFFGNVTGTATGLSNTPNITVGSVTSGNINAVGIVTATTFVGNFTGTVTGDATGLTGTPNIYVGFVTSKTILPISDNTYNLGSPVERWANIYSADMHFSNEGSSNSVDGTWGNWTLQEGENDIFMLNNRTGKKYKINLTEV
jgi:hypothetical protein